jgi:ATP-binding cassette subfamily B protein
MIMKNRVLKFILNTAKPSKVFLFGIAFSMSCVAVDKNIKPYLIKYIINGVSQNDYSNFIIILGIYAFLQFAIVCAWAFFDWCMSKSIPQMKKYITETMVNDISKYPYKYFQEHLSGRITAKINDAVKSTTRVIDTALVGFLQLFILIITSVILLATVHYGFALAMIFWLAIFVMITYYFSSRIGKLSSTEAEAGSQVSGALGDYFTNIFTIKVFSSRDYEKKRLDRYLDDYVNKSRAKHLYVKSFFTRQGVIFSCYILCCLCSMIFLAKRDMISPGDFALVFMLNFEVVSSLFHLATMMNDFMSNWGSIAQALVILDSNPDIQDKIGAVNLKVQFGQINFNNVSFSYHGMVGGLFENKSIIIQSGSKVGLVGYSGGGKTTFVHLIMRLFDVNTGSILIDDQDIRDVTQDSLRSAISMIPQDPNLFHRSLLENIQYGCFDASEDEVISAAKKAYADGFIAKLPEGYKSMVGERGVKLSGGQRQRIAIARAILKNAPILILDEATSQLDSVTESLIQESLAELMQNKTTIIIAHRLSTLLHMDRILVFDQGQIVEDGTHQELIRKHGLYKTLWDAQVGGFLPDKNDNESSIN